MSKFPSLFVIAKPEGTVLCYTFSAIDNDFFEVFQNPQIAKDINNIRIWNSSLEAQNYLNHMKSMSRYDWNPGTGCYIDFENGESLRPEEFADVFVLEYKPV